MARHHHFSVEFDGRRAPAFWTLLQGNRICVQWNRVVEHAELKPGEDPEKRAAKVLLKILEKDRKEREAWAKKHGRVLT